MVLYEEQGTGEPITGGPQSKSLLSVFEGQVSNGEFVTLGPITRNVLLKQEQTQINLNTKSEIQKQHSETQFQECLILNPIMRANIIYWASSIRQVTEDGLQLEQEVKDFIEMVDVLHANPVLPNYLDHKRCSFHRAVIGGNDLKLRALLKQCNHLYLHTISKKKTRYEKQPTAPTNLAPVHPEDPHQNQERLKQIDSHILVKRDADQNIDQDFRCMLKDKRMKRYLRQYKNAKTIHENIIKESNESNFEINQTD